MPIAIAEASFLTLLGWVSAFYVVLTVSNLLFGFAMERILWKWRRIFDVPLAPGQYRFELIGNLVFLAIAIPCSTLVLASHGIRFGAPSLGRQIGTFLAMMLGFQVFYYALHRGMHHRSLIRFHRWHHRSHVTTPLSGQSMSPVEALGWMVGYLGLPLLFSLITPIGFWGYVGYLAFNITGNIVGHANVEPKLIRAGIWQSSAFGSNAFMYHALHHARWTGHFGFQASTMDRLFGTEWPDWPVLFRRITDGKPLTSLKERGDDSSK